jgi:hypothetical protein
MKIPDCLTKPQDKAKYDIARFRNFGHKGKKQVVKKSNANRLNELEPQIHHVAFLNN